MTQTIPTTSETHAGILKTTDYSIFKGVIGNRGINESLVADLRRSLEKRNLLAANPIVVNEKMEVVDGQHRLLAARELGLPVFYTIVDDAGLMEIQLLNANKRQWITQDYLESFIAMGKKDYIRLKNFADEYRISIAIALRIMNNFNDSKGALMKFRAGDFVIEDYDRADRVASLVTAVRDYSPDMAWSHRPCVKALAIVQETLDDPKQLIDQLKRYNQVVTRRMSVRDYLDQFENILNANRTGKAVKLTQEEKE